MSGEVWMYRDEDEGNLTTKQLEETAYGRSQGWDLELEGRVIAYLDEPNWEDMFWISYRITPTTDDEILARQLLSTNFWSSATSKQLTFRSRALGVVAPHAFASLEPFVSPGRLNMRALYITLEAYSLGPKVPSADKSTHFDKPQGWLSRLRAWWRERRDNNHKGGSATSIW